MNASAPKTLVIPEHWSRNTWEEKARENPLNAIMTSVEMSDAAADDFSDGHLELFFKKGVRLYEEHLKPLMPELPDAKENAYIVEYGCGAGRILKALVEEGYRVGGIDISETMLGHCARLVPETKDDLFPLDAQGRTKLPGACASMVFSNAVVQHIESLAKYTTAFDEMCRILKPGGILAVQVNCEDYIHGDLSRPDRTENFEDHSLHTRAGETKPYARHNQDMWSGVYIGEENLKHMLASRGVAIEKRYFRDAKKLRAMWFIGRKAV